MKLRIALKNLKGAFASVWFNIATSDRLSFASVAIDKSNSLTLPRRESLCHRWSHDQPQPGSFSQRQRKAVKRELGNEVAEII